MAYYLTQETKASFTPMKGSFSHSTFYMYDNFIRATLGRYLPQCLQEVAELRPENPIEFIAQWLYHVYDSQMYYKEKVKYLQELCTTDKAVAKEQEEHTARLKPFMDAMRFERWNYFISLTEEMEALTEYLATADRPVDQLTEQRYLVVKKLILEEEDKSEVEFETLLRNMNVAKAAFMSSQVTETEQARKPMPKSTGKTDSQDTVSQISAKSDATKSTKSSVKSKTSEKPLSRHQMRGTRRIVRDSKSPVRRQMRARSVAVCTQIRTRASTLRRRSHQSNRVEESEEDSDDSMLSSRSRDDSECHSVTTQNKESRGRNTRHSDRRGMATSTIFRYLPSNQLSESCETESLRSSTDNLGDSDNESTVETKTDCFIKGRFSKQNVKLDDFSQLKQPQRKQAVTSVSRAKRRHEDTWLPFKGEVIGSQASTIDCKQSSDGSLSLTHSPSCGVVAFIKAPVVDTPDLQKSETSTSKEQKRALLKKPVWIKQEIRPRTTESSSAVEDDEDCMSDADVKEETARSISRRKGQHEQLHLPPVRAQTGPRGMVAYTDDHIRVGGSRDQHMLDHVVQLPAIQATGRSTGTLIMTNVGHIAYISKEFGVVASNALKIRNVHPLDKPEMWEQRQFQCQSFYDHELYSQSDILTLDSEEDDHTYLNIPRMTLEEFMGPTHGRCSRTKDKRPS